MNPIKTRVAAELFELYSRNAGEPGTQFDASAITAQRKITLPNQDVDLTPGVTFAAAGGGGASVTPVALGSYAFKDGGNSSFASIVSGTLPSLLSGDVLRLRATGWFITTLQNSFSLEFRLVVDAQVICDTAASLFIPDTSVNNLWELDALVRLVTVAGASSFYQNGASAKFYDGTNLTGVGWQVTKTNQSVSLAGALAASVQVSVGGGADLGVVCGCNAATLERVRA